VFYDQWEIVLEDALREGLKLGDMPGLGKKEKE
jgi:hypothetical protein